MPTVTMAGINGTSVKLTIGVDPVAPATTITVWKGVAQELSCNFDTSVAEIGVTSKYNNGWEENIPGLKKGTLSCEANTIYTNDAGFYNQPDLLAMTLQRKIKTFRMGTGNSGDPTYQFQGFFTKVSSQAEMEAAGKLSFDISMTTEPTLVP